jgi:hypothetical protein
MSLWVSGASSLSTTGTVSISSTDAAALDVAGRIQAGSGNVTITDATGNVLESAIADGTVLARNAGTETITGAWTFNHGTTPVVTVSASGTTIGLQVRGRASDDNGAIQFASNTGGSGWGTITGLNTSALQFAATGGFLFTSGRVHSNTSQPGFLAYQGNSGTALSSGTTTIPFDVEVYDQGGVFGSNTFQAPVTGHYLIALAAGIATNSGAFDVRLVTTGATYQIGRHISTEVRTAAATLVVPMTVSDTAILQVTTSDTGNLVGLSGGVRYTWFSARLVL